MRHPVMLLPVLALSVASSVALATEASAELPLPSAELMAPRTRSARQPTLHPAVVLRDEKGSPVSTSGEAVSASRTCDGCHDVAWIKEHDGHAPVAGSVARLHPATSVSGNCFLCHVRSADNGARLSALADNLFDWAETATLAGTGLVGNDGDGWRWRKEAFQANGGVAAATLELGRPGSRACGFCHGRVHEDPAPMALATDSSQRMTDLGGMVFSGQRISDSAVNLAGKSELHRPWDVHAERMLNCASCHFSPNHPAYAHATAGPGHLQFDARRVSITEYLRRPDHRLARGASDGGHDGSIRRCESCHDAPAAHRWLPRVEQHFAALLCESCHLPKAYAPARQETDWTMLTAEREPRVVYRGGSAEGFVTGFRPVLLPRQGRDGDRVRSQPAWPAAERRGRVWGPSQGPQLDRRLAPNNLVVTYAWIERVGGKARPVEREVLEKAFFLDGAHRLELVRALDRNGDGRLVEGELALDSDAKVKLARELLAAAGVKAPELSGEIIAHELHHGVSPGRYATRECSTCHTAGSRLAEPMLVATSMPVGVSPVFSAESDGRASGSLVHDGQGRVWFQPDLAGLHVFGHTRSGLADGLGALMVAGAFAVAGIHAFLRIRSARRRDKERS